ncbi:Aspartyl/asparaginyl beta-hydroxylase [Durusdinium trenchii]|uniref:Choline transporter-like protein n=1 Tax=Durusdinium trenchii TaxID=1381693 RepID=A0ABP0RR62_9DINO
MEASSDEEEIPTQQTPSKIENQTLLPKDAPVANGDRQDVLKGECNPWKVERRCTDCLWHIPFGITIAMCFLISYHSGQVGEIQALFRLPDFMGYTCGGPFRPDKTYLYFCMDTTSQHIFDEKNKTLAKKYPICLSKCPETFNTSSLCYIGGAYNSSKSWQWVQDYPSQTLAGCICRPHSTFALSLLHEFEDAMMAAPPNLTMLLFFRNWPIFALSALVSIFFSITFIFMLSKCATTLILTAFSLLIVIPLVLCLFFAINFEKGSFVQICGHGAGDFDDLLRAVLAGGVCIFHACQMRSIWNSLDSAGRALEKACKCILSTPSLVLMPLILSVQRGILLVWWLWVVGNYFTSELHDNNQKLRHAVRSNNVSGLMKRAVWGSSEPWEFYLGIPILYTYCAAFFTFGVLWFNEVMTCSAVFVMFFIGQVHELVSPVTKTHIRCRTMRGYWILCRYHAGSVILGGLLQLCLAPLHMTLGIFEDANTANPIGFIVESFCSCVLDFYRNHIGYLKRDALQDVSLFSMDYLKAANHQAEHVFDKAALLQDVRVLNTQTRIFQLAGLGLAFLFGWMTAAQRLQMSPYHDRDEDEFVRDPFSYCIFGAIAAVWVALPFMKIFDVVSDAVIYSIFVKEMHKPPPQDLVMDTFRNCTWTRTMVSAVTNCHCATQRNLLPVNRPPASIAHTAMASSPATNGWVTQPLVADTTVSMRSTRIA